MQFKQAISEIENAQLSPNLTEINKHLQANKDRLDLRQDDDLTRTFKMATGSPRRLKAAGLSHDLSMLNADLIMAEGNERFQTIGAQSTRAKDINKLLLKQHPPRLSPTGRQNNRSVDPVMKRNNLMGSNVKTLKTTGKFGKGNPDAVGGYAFSSAKKMSMNHIDASAEKDRFEDSRLTSKYNTFDLHPGNEDLQAATGILGGDKSVDGR